MGSSNQPGGQFFAPVIGRHRGSLVDGSAEAGHDFLAGALEADDADVGIELDRLFDVGEVEGGDVADEAFGAALEDPLEPLADARCAGFDVPGEEGWFFVGEFGVGLPVEDAGQQVTAALSGAHSENDLSLHGPPVVEKSCRGSAAPGKMLPVIHDGDAGVQWARGGRNDG